MVGFGEPLETARVWVSVAENVQGGSGVGLGSLGGRAFGIAPEGTTGIAVDEVVVSGLVAVVPPDGRMVAG